MVIDYNLQFIEKKLSEARTAVMYIDGEQLVKLPNDVITFIRADAEGRLLFSAHKPRCPLVEYEQSFPIRLFFYRKGIGFYVETSGVATIAGPTDRDEVKEELPENCFLLKMTPRTVEYTETAKRVDASSIRHAWNSFIKWIISSLSPTPVHHMPVRNS